MPVKIFLPWKNLSCLGFRIGKLYFDFFLTPHIGMFIRLPQYRIWLRFWKVKIECLVEKPQSSCITCRKIVTQPKWHWILHHSFLIRKVGPIIALLFVLAMAVSGCKLLFPTAIDPCPTPPGEHLDKWAPIYGPTGEVMGYVCTGGNK